MHLSKKCSAFKVVLGALVLVALLQMIYLSFLSKLHGKQQRYRYSELFGSSGKKNANPEKNSRKERLRYSLSTGGIFDPSGQYRVYKNLIKSDFSTNQKPGVDASSHFLALATHTSINNLHHLNSLVERWQNPLSVAIFAHGQDVKFATALVYALTIFCPQIQALVDFHLVCHSGQMASFPEQDREHFTGLEDCAAVFARLETHRDKYQNYAIGRNVSYPNNLLRNVARGGSEANYILVIDIDMAPSADLHQQFLALVMRREPATDEVFVLPAFEIRHVRKMPATKSELVQLYQVGEVRPFYEELCPRCQAPTNYSQWVNRHSQGLGPLDVAYTLSWVDPWEPFYIGHRTVPLYDENFRQYGFNRISQACELHVAGYRFSVLNSAFVVHKGFKVQGEFHSRKDEENRRNRLLFRSFKEGLKTKYPSSPRRC
ncbi:beta-1,4-glucuronyltransferase 1 [Salvelinus fontinalis]|uniref:beta-1,4-glucuronyltransferase 1 n=1 Tax=Salvelinus fontinalis TaxID=8038 RepID=UPI002485F91A|nr:beta-1,4-glucuronyltransferase 1 [Salvelinus fontinalis]XP_055756956.1 beta-1,4-glucuronyltransferase 1 [Salvelinus fontinalis]